jgi:hypothetical protein
LPDLTPCESVEDYPNGWPQLAAFINSDDNLAVVRRFGLLQSRLLVMLQAEITNLESKLHKLDQEDNESQATHYRLQTTHHKEEWGRERKHLTEEIQTKLNIYWK